MSIDEQNWLALRYVLDELPDAERDSFEQRLVDDPSLCEAVMKASRLVLTSRAALQPEVSLAAPAADRTGPSRRSSWLAICAASISAAVMALFALQISLSTRPSTSVAHHDPAAAELVSLWHSGSGDDSEADDADGDLADGPGDVSVPGWMLAAVSLESANDPGDKVQEN